MIQLIATDMDGTLLDNEKRLPPQLPALLEELYRRDITFAVASGRSHMMLTNLFGGTRRRDHFHLRQRGVRHVSA